MVRQPQDRQALLTHIGVTNQRKNYESHMLPLIEKQWLTMTIPNKPTSPNQKYLTTLKGRIILEILNAKIHTYDSISIRGLSETNLKLARQFYQVYPEIGGLILSNFSNLLTYSIRQMLTDELQTNNNETLAISQMPSDELQIGANISKSENYYRQVLERIPAFLSLQNPKITSWLKFITSNHYW